jgi:hypothetical protein
MFGHPRSRRSFTISFTIAACATTLTGFLAWKITFLHGYVHRLCYEHLDLILISRLVPCTARGRGTLSELRYLQR